MCSDAVSQRVILTHSQIIFGTHAFKPEAQKHRKWRTYKRPCLKLLQNAEIVFNNALEQHKAWKNTVRETVIEISAQEEKLGKSEADTTKRQELYDRQLNKECEKYENLVKSFRKPLLMTPVKSSKAVNKPDIEKMMKKLLLGM